MAETRELTERDVRRLDGIKQDIGELTQQVRELEHEAATILAGADEGEEWIDALDIVIDWSTNWRSMTTAELLRRFGVRRMRAFVRASEDQ